MHLRGMWVYLVLLWLCEVSIQAPVQAGESGYTFTTIVTRPSGDEYISVRVEHLRIPIDDIPEELCNTSPLEGFQISVINDTVNDPSGEGTLQLPFDHLKLKFNTLPSEVNVYWKGEDYWEELEQVQVKSSLVFVDWPLEMEGIFITAVPCKGEHIMQKRGVPSLPHHPNPTMNQTNGIELFGDFDPEDLNIPTMPIEADTVFGSAVSRLPIKLPPGRLGMEPSFSIQYNSAGGNGWLGLKWSLSGMSSFTINPSPRGVPLYNATRESENYLLDGDQIVKLESVNTRTNDAFYTRTSETDFATIQRIGNSPSEYSWKVTTKGGTTSYYGSSSNSRLTAGDNIYQWLLNRQEDLYGNYIKYTYEKVPYKEIANQIYLKDVTYTGDRTHGEGPYQASFKRKDNRRDDVRISCLFGACEQEDYLLEEILVSFEGTQIRKYLLEYITGGLKNSLLSKITELGKNNGELAAYEMKYYDNVKEGKMYGDEETWTMPQDDVKQGVFECPALGSSHFEGGGIHGFIGVSFPKPSKFVAGGAKLGGSWGSTNGKTELIDLTADGLPDKVFMKDGKVSYRKNLGNGEFDPYNICETDIGGFFQESIKAVIKGAELYVWLGQANYYKITTNTKSDSYWADVNGDLYMDIVHENTVYFGYKKDGVECTQFDTDSSKTLKPIEQGYQPNTGPAMRVLQEQVEEDYAESAVLDTVKRWTAPYNGRIEVEAEFVCTAVFEAKRDGVRVAIQKNGQEQWSATWTEESDTPKTTTLQINVEAGDHIYIRSGTWAEGAGGEVAYSTTITYPFYADQVDSNGKDLSIYNSESDFTLWGMQYSMLTLQQGGDALVDGVLTKPYETSDNLTVAVFHNGDLVYSVDIAANYTGNFYIRSDLFSTSQNDTLWTRIMVDSPIEPNGITFAPTLAYPGTATNFSLITSLDTYSPLLHEGHPPSPWVATRNGSLTLSASLVLDSVNSTFMLDKYNVAIVVKSEENPVAKAKFNIQSSGNLTLNVIQGATYFFEVTCGDDVASILTSYELTATLDGASVTVPSAFYVQRNTSLFSNPYRGWAQAVYNSLGREEDPLDEEKLRLFAPMETDEEPSPEELEDMQKSFETDQDAYVVTPSFTEDVWKGPCQTSLVTASHLTSCRTGPAWIKTDEEVDRKKKKKRSSSDHTMKSKRGYSKQDAWGASLIVGGSKTTGDANGVLDYMDMNADGYPDLVMENKIWYTNGDTGKLNEDPTPVALPQIGKSSVSGWTLGIGGNPSVIYANCRCKSGTSGNNANAKGGGWKAALSTLNGQFNAGKNSNEEKHTLIDINGDSLPDDCRIPEDGGDLYCYLNLGYSFHTTALTFDEVDSISKGAGSAWDLGLGFSSGYADSILEAGGGVSGSKAGSWLESALIDITGDGLPDWVYKDDNYNVYVRINTGSGFAEKIKWDEADEDFQSRFDYSLDAGAYFTVTIPTGPLIPVFIVLNFGGNAIFTVSGVKRQFEDVNGDGIRDKLYSTNSDMLKVQLSKVEETNYLKSIKSPLGFFSSVTYKREGNTNNLPQSYYVPRIIKHEDGVSDDSVGNGERKEVFSYSKGKYDVVWNEFYGFEEVSKRVYNGNDFEVEELTTNCVANYACRGQPLKIIEQDSAGNKYYELVKEYTPKKFEVSTFYALTSEKAYHYEGQENSRVSQDFTYEYDNIGNMKKLVYSGDYPGQDMTYELTYSGRNCGASNKPLSMEQKLGTDLLRKNIYEVDCAKGHYTSASSWLNKQGTLTARVDILYDDYGNLKKWTSPENYKHERYATEYEYDSVVNTHITKISDSYHDSSQTTYDYMFGVPLESIDINNQKVTYKYDQFGRVTSFIGPMEQNTQIKTKTCEYRTGSGDIPAHVISTFYDRFGKADSDYLRSCTFIDGFHRVIQEKVDAELFIDGTHQKKVLVSGKEKFDDMGRIVRQYYPTYEARSELDQYTDSYPSISPTKFAYDPINRLRQTTFPNNEVLKLSYTFEKDQSNQWRLMTTEEDALHYKVYTTHTYNKDVTSIKEAWLDISTMRNITTKFSYDSEHQLKTQQHEEAPTDTFAYDMLGRLTEKITAKSGTTTYEYDGASNLLSERTSNLKSIDSATSIKYQYEYLRRTEINYPINKQNDVIYKYGTASASNSAGRIKFVNDSSGEEYIEYDSLGHITKSTKIPWQKANGIKRQPYDTIQIYETWGRLARITYPDGEVVTYSYDTGGKLTEAEGKKNSTNFQFVTDAGYDQFGRIIYLKYGNDVTVTKTFDSTMNWLSHKTIANNFQTLENSSYAYDKLGRLTQKINDIGVPLPPLPHLKGGPANYSFTYDALDRIVSSSQQYRTELNKRVTYDLQQKFNSYKALDSKRQETTEWNRDTSLPPAAEPKWNTPKPTKQSYEIAYTYLVNQHPYSPKEVSVHDLDPNGDVLKYCFYYDEDKNMDNYAFSSEKGGQKSGVTYTQQDWEELCGAWDQSILNNEPLKNPYSYWTRKIIWNEDDRISAIYDDTYGKTSTMKYAYDHTGRRSNKFSEVGVAGEDIYVNPYYVIERQNAMKYIFFHGERVAATRESGYVNCAGPVPGEDCPYFFVRGDSEGTNWVTNMLGHPRAHYEYTPSGEPWVSEHFDPDPNHPVSDLETPYMDHDMQWDEETKLYYSKAGYRDPRLDIALRMEAKNDKRLRN